MRLLDKGHQRESVRGGVIIWLGSVEVSTAVLDKELQFFSVIQVLRRALTKIQASDNIAQVFNSSQQIYIVENQMSNEGIKTKCEKKIIARQSKRQKEHFVLFDRVNNQFEWLPLRQVVKTRSGRQIYLNFLEEEKNRLLAQMSSDDEIELRKDKKVKTRPKSMFSTPPSKMKSNIGQELECQKDKQQEKGMEKVKQSPQNDANPQRTPKKDSGQLAFTTEHHQLPQNQRPSKSSNNQHSQRNQCKMSNGHPHHIPTKNHKPIPPKID